MYQILTWSLMYCRRTREKFWSSKVGKKIVCRYSLPSVRVWHSAKKWFAECLPAGTRQTWTAGGGRYLTPLFAKRQGLPRA